jgi:hypothetical protein
MMLPERFWFGVAFAWTLCCSAGEATSNGSNNDNHDYQNEDRSLHEIITTAECPNIRVSGNYPARLDLIYVYSLMYSGALDVVGIERAIATSVASALNTCGNESQPLYAVELSNFSKHHLIVAGKRNLFYPIGHQTYVVVKSNGFSHLSILSFHAR